MRKKKFKDVFDKIMSEIFVDKYNCIACDSELQEPLTYGLCEHCKTKLQFIGDNICKKCGRLQLNEADYCLTCQEHKRQFDFARSCVVYDDVAKEIVRGFKFGGKKYLAKYLAKFMAERFKSTFGNIEIDIIVPVPLTKRKKVERGYNQSWEIVKKFASILDMHAVDGITAKVKDTQEQARLDGKAREENIQGAFEVKLPKEVENKNVLVIDDVMTTGSTASEIARVLKIAKAKEVYLLTFASTRYHLPEQNKHTDNK